MRSGADVGDHKVIKAEARNRAAQLRHDLGIFRPSIRVMFPLYITTCKLCGRPAVVRPRPTMFEERFGGAALTEICPVKGGKKPAEIN